MHPRRCSSMVTNASAGPAMPSLQQSHATAALLVATAILRLQNQCKQLQTQYGRLQTQYEC